MRILRYVRDGAIYVGDITVDDSGGSIVVSCPDIDSGLTTFLQAVVRDKSVTTFHPEPFAGGTSEKIVDVKLGDDLFWETVDHELCSQTGYCLDLRVAPSNENEEEINMQVTKKLEDLRSKRRSTEDARLHNIVDMALGFSAMMRLFEEGSKDKILQKFIASRHSIFDVTSAFEFKAAHNGFCEWGVNTIKRAEREKGGVVVKASGPASYGQMAKTLDVVLHVTVHYAQYPNPEKALMLSKLLNTAMDTKMMAFLSGCYPDALKPWPKTIEQLDNREDYQAMQDTVRRFIQEEHQWALTPVDVDDVYWEALNR
jgi:hypothetical protein